MKTIITHANCSDGFTAAWAAYVPGDDVIYASYGDPVPDGLEDKAVVILDFSYPRETLEALHAKCSSLLVLDHHKTAQADLAGLPYCQFDMARSGAKMAWDHFRTGPSVLVDYVQDRDLWRHALPYTREINACLRWTDRSFERWDELHHLLLMKDGVAGLARAGHLTLDLIRRITEESAKHPGVVTLPDGKRIAVINRGLLFASELGSYLVKRYDVDAAAIWNQGPDGTYFFSLRSDGKLDCSGLAKAFGGGGHAGAAGFRIGYFPWSGVQPLEDAL